MMFGHNSEAPPLNDLLQPDIYSRLDAEAIERTRVANTQLHERLRLQEKVLAKYRQAAERFHARQLALVRRDLKRITDKLPAASRIADFRSRFLQAAHSHQESEAEVKVRKVRGIPEEKPDMPFCERYFIHHLPNKKKFYKQRTPTPPFKHAVDGDAAQGSLQTPGEALLLPSLTISGEGAAGPTDGPADLEAVHVTFGSQPTAGVAAELLTDSQQQRDESTIEGHCDGADKDSTSVLTGQQSKKRGQRSVSFPPIENNGDATENCF